MQKNMQNKLEWLINKNSFLQKASVEVRIKRKKAAKIVLVKLIKAVSAELLPNYAKTTSVKTMK